MNLTQKISQMTPKGADLDATDLIEVSTIVGGSYVTKSITGQELIDAIPLPPTGITIGTTAITSGTVGRVLFEGTGNVVQESANLFWDATNNRLGIGTSSPINTLHVVGGQLIKATADGFESIKLQNFANTYPNTISFYKSNGTTQTVVLGDNGASVAYPFITGMRADYGFVGNKNSGFHIFAGTNIAQTIHTTGNIGINTTTDAGFRLDVNGNSRVRGAGATGSTNAFTVQNSSGSSALSITNGLTTIVHGDLQLENTVLYWSSGSQIRNISNGVLRISDSTNANFTRLQFGGGTTAFPSLQRSGSALAVMDATGTALTNLLVGTTTDAGFRLDVNGTARVATSILVGSGSGTGTVQTGVCRATYFNEYNNNYTIFEVKSNGNASFYQGIAVGTTSNAVASAQVEIVSTTKGFLPPRQTQAQRTAIASPAVGLQVYQTDGVEGLYVYKSTGWAMASLI